MKHTRKRILSLLSAGVMTLTMLPAYLPASAYPQQSDYSNDPTDLTIDFSASAKDAETILQKMREAQNHKEATTYTPDGSGDKETLDAIYKNYNHLPWRHVTNWSCNDDPWHKSYWYDKYILTTTLSRGSRDDRLWTDEDGDVHAMNFEDWYRETQAPYTLRGALESTDPNDTYVALADDADHEEHQQDPWEPIVIKTDKVLDLNGHTIDMQYDRNRENSDQHRQNHSKPETHYCWAFEIENGATLTIIDSSAWRGEGGDGEGTGTIKFTACMVNPFDWDIDFYTTRDLFYVNNGNLVVYGGTFQAGRRKVRIKDNFSWDKLKTAIGTAVEMGVNIAEYATGLNTATAGYDDILDKLNQQRNPSASNQAAEPDGDLDEDRTSGASDMINQNGSNGNPHKETKVQNPESKDERNQTIAEKKAEAAKDGKESGKQDNQSNKDGSAKSDKDKKGKHTQLAEAQNNIINKATDKNAIGHIVNSAFSLADQIAQMCGSDEKSRVTQTIMGSVVKVGSQGSFVSYGGKYVGYGQTPNTRNAVIEMVNSPGEPLWWDKTKNNGGVAYIYDGLFEGWCGANIFNFVRDDVLQQSEYTWCSDNKGEPKKIELSEGETAHLKIMYYQNQADLDAGKDVDPIPINTANVQVRGGTFRCYYDLQNIARNEDEDDSTHFRKFPGTPGMVNLGPESFSKELIQDGRIQISDCYGDGALVLMDERSEEVAGYEGIYHYRLFCSDLELRYKNYLYVYPNNNPKISASRSMALSTYYNDNKTTKQLFTDDSAQELEKNRNNIRAPYRQTEYYFDVLLQSDGKLNYSVMPNFRIGGQDDVQANTDYKGQLLKQSEVWYYPEPLDAKGDMIKDFAYGDFFATIPYHDSGRNEEIHDRDLCRPSEWAAKIKEDCWNDHKQFFFYEGWDNIRRQLHYFTYKVYRVDPLSRENIMESPDGDDSETMNDMDADHPLITVRYGDSTDALKCKLPLDLLQEEIGKKYDDPQWRFNDGEMYRIVLETEEFVEFGNGGGGSLDKAKCTTSILFRCYKDAVAVDEENRDTQAHLKHDFTPLQWEYNAREKTAAPSTTTTTAKGAQTTTTTSVSETLNTQQTGTSQIYVSGKSSDIITGLVETKETAVFTGEISNIITGEIGTVDPSSILSHLATTTTAITARRAQPAPDTTPVTSQADAATTTTTTGSGSKFWEIVSDIFEILDALNKKLNPNNAIAADSYATINIVNGQAGMVDYWGDKKIFDVYYQWWEVDSKGNPIRMFAGTDFVYNKKMGDKEDHLPKLWNFSAKNEDGKLYTFCNTVDPLDPKASTYDTNGLPKREGDWKWTDKQIHMYSAELTEKDTLKKKQNQNLTMANNKRFATGSDTCYIPQEMAGKYIAVKAVVLNTKWDMAFDQKQTFWSHTVKVVDGHEDIQPELEVKLDEGMDYATYEHPATLSVTELKNLTEGEVVSYLRFYTPKGEKEFENLNVSDPADLPTLKYPQDFFDYDANDTQQWESIAAHEGWFSVNIITSKGGKVFRDAIYAKSEPFSYEVEAKEIKRWVSDEVNYKMSEIKSGEKTDGFFCFSLLPKKASIGTWGIAEAVSTNPKVATLDEKGRLWFGEEAGETTITFKGLKNEDISLKVTIIDDFDHFEISGIKPPVIGQKFDRTSPKVPDDAPYEITDVKWYYDDNINYFEKEIPEDAVAKYYQPYYVRVFVKPKEGHVAKYYSTYDMTVELPNGETEVKSGTADSLDHHGIAEDDVFGFWYMYPALTDHEAKVVDRITLDFPTEVKEGDNFRKWLESVKLSTNGYNAGFEFEIAPIYDANADKIASAYGYRNDSLHQINHFIQGVQTGLTAKITIPYELKWMGDEFAEEVKFVINGKESTVKPGSKTVLTIELPDSIHISAGEALTVLPEYSLNSYDFVVGEPVVIKDLLNCSDPAVSIVYRGFYTNNSKNWQEYFSYDAEKGTLTPIKAASFNWSDDLVLLYDVVYDANGDGYPEYEDHRRNSIYKIYEKESDIPEQPPVTEKEPVKVTITVQTPDGKTASEAEYAYKGSLDIIPVPEDTFVTGIIDKDGKSVSGSDFKTGESYTVQTVSADSIEIHPGADRVYAFFTDADGKNLKDMQISVDNAHYTKADCITGLTPDTDYTLYYKKGIGGKVYTAKFRTAKQSCGVTVGRIPVTDQNLGDLNSDGWHYDPETKTLTLKDFTLNDVGTIVKTIAAGTAYSYTENGMIAAEDDLTLVLIGKNTILNPTGLNHPVYGKKNLTVTGNGDLTIQSDDSMLVSENGDICLNGTGTLKMTSSGIGLRPLKGTVKYTNGTIDYQPKEYDGYTSGSLYVKKDTLDLSGKVHDVTISNGKQADGMTKITESELPETSAFLRIEPQHKDVNKVVSDETYATGTCDKGCKYHLSCDCGHIGEELFEVKADAHSLVKHDAKAATCKQTGTVEYWECEHCGARFADAKASKALTDADMIVPTLAHKLVHKDEKAVSCTENGMKEHWECSLCGECFADKVGKTPLDTKTAVTPKTGHDWIHYTAKAATCTDEGRTEYWKCTNCGQYSADKDGKKLLTEAAIKVKALGHDWSEWTVSKEATANAEGEETHSCKRCKITETRVIPKKGTTTTTITSTTKATTTTTSTTKATTTTTSTTKATTTTTSTTKATTSTTSTTKATTTTTSTTKATTTTTSTTKATTSTTSTTKATTSTTSTTKATTNTTSTTKATTSTTSTTKATTSTTSTTKATTTTTSTTKATTTTTSTTKATTTTTSTTKATTTTSTTTTTTTDTTTSTTVTSATESTETTVTTSETTPTEPEYLLGDINDDGEVSVEDAQLALLEYVNAMTGLESSLTDRQKLAADVNGDKEISVEDAQTILLYYVSNTLSGENVTWDDLLGKKPQGQQLPFLVKIKDFFGEEA